eukprot:SAG11_NODE_25990_length_351_cov_0.793651_1_plen_35_part_01
MDAIGSVLRSVRAMSAAEAESEGYDDGRGVVSNPE